MGRCRQEAGRILGGRPTKSGNMKHSGQQQTENRYSILANQPRTASQPWQPSNKTKTTKMPKNVKIMI